MNFPEIKFTEIKFTEIKYTKMKLNKPQFWVAHGTLPQRIFSSISLHVRSFLIYQC